MTVTLELPLYAEAQIGTEAAQKGMPLPEYLIAVIGGRHQRVPKGSKTYLLSHPSLAKDWLRPEEEEAWQDL